MNDAVVFSKLAFKESPEMNFFNFAAVGILLVEMLFLSEVIF
jgi:hypothetical protein